jgi:hypothetical protein
MNHFDELKDPNHAIEYLADSLSDGSLVLFLGAGTSVGFGLPNWLKLVNALRLEVSLPEINDTSSADDLQHAADEIDDVLKNKFDLIDLIEKHLYNGFDDLSLVSALENHLLVSISALLMGSKRGHVTRVVTLNYDSMLEWFLSLFGFVVKTIYQLPELEGSEDIRIYHPHGFVPIPKMGLDRSNFVILGMHSANQRLGNMGDPWFEMTRHILDTGICLFIGMSGNTLSDRILSPLLADIRPLGIWILLGELTRAKEHEFARNNIIPMPIKESKDISEFLLKICQKASEKLLK